MRRLQPVGQQACAWSRPLSRLCSGMRRSRCSGGSPPRSISSAVRRPGPGTARRVGSHSSESLRRIRLQGLVEGHVEVNRPGRRAHRVLDGPAHDFDQRVWAAPGQVARGRQRQVRLEAHAFAEDPGLPDRLVGIGAPHLRGPVGADDDQRDIGQVGFHHRRQQVRHGGPRRGDDRRGPEVRSTVADREEAGAPLVQVYPDPQSRNPVRGQNQWRGPGTRRNLHLLHARLGERREDGIGPPEVEVAADHHPANPNRLRRGRRLPLAPSPGASAGT